MASPFSLIVAITVGVNPHRIVAHDGFDFFRIDTEPIGQVFWFHHAVGEYASPFLHVLSFRLHSSGRVPHTLASFISQRSEAQATG